jgi:hypothetical protein
MPFAAPFLARAAARWQQHLSTKLELAAARQRSTTQQALLDRLAPYEAELAETVRAWNEDEEADVLAFLLTHGEVPLLATLPREDRLTETLAGVLIALWLDEWHRQQPGAPSAEAGGQAVRRVRQAAQTYLGTTQRWLDEQVGPLVTPGSPSTPSLPAVLPTTVQEAVRLVYERSSSQRAVQVAVTEATRMAQAAAYEIARAQGLTQLVWAATLDDKTCPWCAELHGTVVTLDEPLFFLGESIVSPTGKTLEISYDDLYHPPLHPSCRCALVEQGP